MEPGTDLRYLFEVDGLWNDSNMQHFQALPGTLLLYSRMMPTVASAVDLWTSGEHGQECLLKHLARYYWAVM